MDNFSRALYCTKKMKNFFATDNRQQVAEVEVPDNIEINSLEYILYIFYSCLLDYGMRSKIYHANLIKTYQEHSEIFKPGYVVEKYFYNEEELLGIIKNNIHPRYPNIALKKWLELSYFIDKNYPGDSLIIKIKQLNSYSDLYNFITNIKGYGQKTGGLLLRLIYESGICSFDGEINDIPIDRHDVEISYLNGIIDKEKLNEKELKDLGAIWIKAAKENDISACDIYKYLWTIGSILCLKKKCLECPLKENCLKKI